jgi:UDP-N-acetylmuramate--alanine ligase
LAAARQRYPEQRVWAVWQPHTYSRLRTLLDDFVMAFDEADCVLVLDVYAAREAAPDDGFTAAAVVERLRRRKPQSPACVHGPLSVPAAQAWLAESLQAGDVMLVLSAGDADAITAGLLTRLDRNGGAHA